MKKIETAPFDAADYLDDEETIAEYLTAALEDPNPDIFLVAVRDVARAAWLSSLAIPDWVERVFTRRCHLAPNRATTRC